MDVANAMLLHKYSRLCMTTWIRSWASRGGKTKLAAHYTCTVYTMKVHITLWENIYLQNGKTLSLPSGKVTLVAKWKRRMWVAVRWVGLTHCWSINLQWTQRCGCLPVSRFCSSSLFSFSSSEEQYSSFFSFFTIFLGSFKWIMKVCLSFFTITLIKVDPGENHGIEDRLLLMPH